MLCPELVDERAPRIGRSGRWPTESLQKTRGRGQKESRWTPACGSEGRAGAAHLAPQTGSTSRSHSPWGVRRVARAEAGFTHQLRKSRAADGISHRDVETPRPRTAGPAAPSSLSRSRLVSTVCYTRRAPPVAWLGLSQRKEGLVDQATGSDSHSGHDGGGAGRAAAWPACDRLRVVDPAGCFSRRLGRGSRARVRASRHQFGAVDV